MPTQNSEWPEVFERLFARSVEQCVEAGRVDGSKLYLDASLVAANGSRNSVIAVVVRREVSKLGEQESGSGDSVNRKLRSTTDPDSTVVRHQSGKPTPSYKNHRALDDQAGVVTAVKTTTGAIDEARELFELIERHERVTAARIRVAVADSRYGNTANLIALARRKIRAHVADLRSKLRNPRSQGIYPPERFVYQPETDSSRCPAAEILSRHHFVARRGYFEYRPKRWPGSMVELPFLIPTSQLIAPVSRLEQPPRFSQNIAPLGNSPFIIDIPASHQKSER